MAAPRVFGVETEFGFTHLPQDRSETPRQDLLQRMERLSTEIAPCVAALGGCGIFLADGGRFYLDWMNGSAKPEFATAECADPMELVKRVQEGDAFLSRLAERIEKEIGGDMLFSKTNVDHASGNSWGCHENQLIRRGFDLAKNLIPFLCTRQILSGSGGFDSGNGLRFVLSTRARFIRMITGRDTLVRRAILDTRDESHARPFEQRIHLIIGEGLHGECSNLLSCATTGLVVGLIEAGVEPGDGVAIRSPLAAIRRFSRDPACQVAVRTSSGSRVRAIDVQRHYLRQAGDHLSKLPVWAEAVCNLWKEVLDGLESGAEQRRLRLDWVIRRHVFENYLKKFGYALDTLPGVETAGGLQIQHGLCELDTKFGRVGPKGIFQMLDARGCLQHRIDWKATPRESVATRAVLRGRQIADAYKSGRTNTVLADWDCLYDEANGQQMDLSDPFETCATWQTLSNPRFRAESWLRRLRSRGENAPSQLP